MIEEREKYLKGEDKSYTWDEVKEMAADKKRTAEQQHRSKPESPLPNSIKPFYFYIPKPHLLPMMLKHETVW